MPIVSLSIPQQLQAVSAGTFSYPSISQVKKNSIVIDEFTRETLNPTDGYQVYTATSNDGNGTATIQSLNRLRLTTDSSAAGDDESVRSSGMAFARVPTAEGITDERTLIVIDITCSLTSAASTEGYVGFDDSGSAMTTLPTTDRHLGLFWDRSASANFFLTSGNASAQVTTDTGIAIDTGTWRVRITWNGINTGIIEFFDDPTSQVADATQNVTAFGAGSQMLHFFVQTETTVAKVLDVREWRVSGL